MMINVLRCEFTNIIELSSVDVEETILNKLNLTGH